MLYESTLELALFGTTKVALSSIFLRVRKDPKTGEPVAIVTNAEDLDTLTGVLLRIILGKVHTFWINKGIPRVV